MIAFEKVAEAFQLPKYPTDITEKHYEEYEELGIEPRSVFEELAILKYLSGPEDDIRAVVLNALYNIYEKGPYDIEEAAQKFFGSYKKIPDAYFIYYFGDAADARIDFKIEKNNWIEAGARMMQQCYKKLYQ